MIQLGPAKSQHPQPPPPRARAGSGLELRAAGSTWSRRSLRRDPRAGLELDTYPQFARLWITSETTSEAEIPTTGEPLNAVPRACRPERADNIHYVNLWAFLNDFGALGPNTPSENATLFSSGGHGCRGGYPQPESAGHVSTWSRGAGHRSSSRGQEKRHQKTGRRGFWAVCCRSEISPHVRGDKLKTGLFNGCYGLSGGWA